MIYTNILIITLIITLIYTLIIILTINKETPTKEEPEERENYYLQLLNMTTGEILLFKNKKEFINSITQYDMIKHFLKGTEEENIKRLIEWYYPEYKKL